MDEIRIPAEMVINELRDRISQLEYDNAVLRAQVRVLQGGETHE